MGNKTKQRGDFISFFYPIARGSRCPGPEQKASANLLEVRAPQQKFIQKST